MARKRAKMPPRNKRNFRPTKSGAGMTEAGVKAYRRANPGSKLKQQSLVKLSLVVKTRKGVSFALEAPDR